MVEFLGMQLELDVPVDLKWSKYQQKQIVVTWVSAERTGSRGLEKLNV
ncbi:hypothetical protein [Croceitalea sp. MTPC5]